MKTPWYIRTVGYYSALKRTQLPSHDKTCGNLKCIWPSERSQCEKGYVLYGPDYMTF